MAQRRVVIAVATCAVGLSFAGCAGEAYVGYDNGTKQTEIRTGVYRSERVERADGSKESRDLYGPHVEIVTKSEGARVEAGVNSH